MIYLYFEISLKSSSFTYLSNDTGPQPIALKNCSIPQNTQQVFESAITKMFDVGFQAFCEWHYKWGRVLAILAHVTWPGTQAVDGSISLNFSLEIRWEFKSFEPA